MDDMFPILRDKWLQLNDDISDSLCYPIQELSCSLQKDILDDPKHEILLDYLVKSASLRELILVIEFKQYTLSLFDKANEKSNLDKKKFIAMVIDTQLTIDLLKECSNIMTKELTEKLSNTKIDESDMIILSDDYFNFRLAYSRLNKDLLSICNEHGERLSLTPELIEKILTRLNNIDDKE